MDITLITICVLLGATAVGLLIWHETRRSKNETAEEKLDRITW